MLDVYNAFVLNEKSKDGVGGKGKTLSKYRILTKIKTPCHFQQQALVIICTTRYIRNRTDFYSAKMNDTLISLSITKGNLWNQFVSQQSFESSSQARQFFSSLGHDGMLVHSMRSKLAMVSTGMRPIGKNAYQFCDILADAVYNRQLLVVLPDAEALRASLMPLATPRVRVKDGGPREKQEQKKLGLTNPRWEHTDEKLKTDRPTLCLEGDTIKLMVDVEGGGSVTFHFFESDKSTKELTEKPIDGTVSGTIGSCSWKVPKEIATLERDPWFEARHPNISSPTDRVELNIAGEIELVFDLDPHNHLYEEYQFTLTSLNREFSYEVVKTIKDDTDKTDDALSLLYTNLNRGTTYQLLLAKHTEDSAVPVMKQTYRQFNDSSKRR